MVSLEGVERFEELLYRHESDGPYNYRTLFTADGFWARRASQKRLTLLKKLDVPLRAMLESSEQVIFLTAGVMYSFWESYFLGLPMYYLNRRALVLTTERLLLIQINSRKRPEVLRSQILLGAVERLSRTGLGNTLVELTSGKRYVFAYIPKADRKALITHLENAKTQGTPSSSAGGIEHLCRHCYAPLAGYPAECPRCHGALKSAAKAGLLSLVFPGLGDLYLGHRGIATFELLVAALLWLGVLLPNPELPTSTLDVAIMAVFVFALLHVPDSIATRYIGRKGYYPAGDGPTRVAPRSATAA